MKRYFKGLITGIIITTLFSYTLGFASSSVKQKIDVIFNFVNIEVNGEKVKTDNILYNDTTYVPLRKVSEMLGKEVGWNGATNTASINDYVNGNDDNYNYLMKNLIVLPETAYDEIEAKQMISRLFGIDNRILRELVDYNVKIKLTTTNVTEVDEYMYLKGITPRGWEGTGRTWDDIPAVGGNPTVARIGYSDPSMENGHGTVNLELHETAHAIDYYIFDDISSKSEFQSIMNKEVDKLFPEDFYNGTYSEEYFAESFAMYHLDDKSNKELKIKAPLTYDFIKGLYKEYVNQVD